MNAGDRQEVIVVGEADFRTPLEKAQLSSLESEQKTVASMLIIKADDNTTFVEMLQQEEIIAEGVQINDGTRRKISLKENDVVVINHSGRLTHDSLLAKIDLSKAGDSTTGNIFLSLGKIPETVIIHVPSPDEFKVGGHLTTYQSLLVDALRLPEQDRPHIIFYTDGFIPQLYLKHEFQGFLFCSTPDELRSVMQLTRHLRQNQKAELFRPEVLEPKQQDAYDHSRLGEWEHRTARTYSTLNLILRRFAQRTSLMNSRDKDRYSRLFERDSQGNSIFHTGKEKDAAPIREPIKILDIGPGAGRISIPLAQAGYNVLGVDLSRTQLRRLNRRIIDEGQGLRGEKIDKTLSYNALLRLQQEGVVANKLETNDNVIKRRLLTVRGSFFELHHVLDQTVKKWSNKFRSVDIFDFFHHSRWFKNRFTEKQNAFLAMGFDAALITWNTFCEIGTQENQKKVLEQVLNVLQRGGELMIEIPDRQMEPHASALLDYHQKHPDQPYGTLRDQKPKDFKGLKGEEEYPPRYFPDINELILLLKSVGYEIDPETDIQSYLIQDKYAPEYFITARKSKM